jgi:hypothetical protein
MGNWVVMHLTAFGLTGQNWILVASIVMVATFFYVSVALFPVGYLRMQTRCPKCTTMVRSNGKGWEILDAACSELSGTRWENSPEFCPTLSHVAEPEVVLPGVASRATVQAEIERIRIVKVRP